ncbi:MAG: hypothetical protein INQ03_20385 [Candidatus Heimdallarchaeota archaeon]|nr:hypothetical protein [Candidatus Heimdallarchaeota archaeon]
MKSIKFLLLIIGLLLFSLQSSAVATAPNITGMETVSASEGTLRLNWTVTDDNIKLYEITLNDTTVVDDGTFDEPEGTGAVRTDIHFLLVVSYGYYSLELRVEDYDGLEGSFTTIVSVSAGEAAGPAAFLPLDTSSFVIGFVALVIVIRKRNQI